MANKSLFQSLRGRLLPKADTRNEAGGVAYRLPPQHELAQYAATGCLNGTFYASAEEQLDRVLELSQDVDAEFLARLAIYSRTVGFMKDMPALLLAVLSGRDSALFAKAFSRVITDTRMLRTFVQILRSGVTGRRSLGTRPKREIQKWLGAQSDGALFCGSVGQSPSLADIVKMVHPRPGGEVREALYAYLIGRDCDRDKLPPLVQEYERFKEDRTQAPPDVPFRFLTSLPLTREQWGVIAWNAPWQMTRMNLNTFARHGVFEIDGMAQRVANRLRSREAIERARVFPYQLLMAFHAVVPEVPRVVTEALQEAMELATANVPTIEGKVYVCPDVSGSMQMAATGQRRGASSAVRCVDVAALVAATLLRKNSGAEVLPFEHDVVRLELNPRDSIMTNAQRLASVGGGGTECSAPLRQLNKRKAKGDLVIFVSDNESWVHGRRGHTTPTMVQWQAFKARNPQAKLVCLDIQPYGTAQAPEREDVLNIGGFSDRVFEVIGRFAAGTLAPSHWVGEIEGVELHSPQAG